MSSSREDCDETTPLLVTNTTTDEVSPELICNRSLWLMVIIFVFGSTIGGYLLYIQGQEYPVSKPFFLVRRSKWGSTIARPTGEAYNATDLPLKCVVVMQVGNESCWDVRGCSRILRDIQKCDKTGDVPFNFLVGGDGSTYEGQGWSNQSLIELPQKLNASACLVLSFIGNFTASSPNKDQVEEAQVWITESMFRSRLSESRYRIFGLRNLTRGRNDGDQLFRLVSRWPHYNSTLGALL